MRYYVLPISILVLLFHIPINAQQSTNDDFFKKQDKALKVDVEYDRFTGITKLQLGPMYVAKEQGDILGIALLTTVTSLDLSAVKKGKKRVVIGALYISSIYPKPRFSTDRSLILLVDGQRLFIGDLTLASSERQSSDQFVEVLVKPIDFDIIVRISKAKKVEGRIGNKEFQVTQFYLNYIKEFVQKASAVKE